MKANYFYPESTDPSARLYQHIQVGNVLKKRDNSSPNDSNNNNNNNTPNNQNKKNNNNRGKDNYFSLLFLFPYYMEGVYVYPRLFFPLWMYNSEAAWTSLFYTMKRCYITGNSIILMIVVLQ